MAVFTTADKGWVSGADKPVFRCKAIRVSVVVAFIAVILYRDVVSLHADRRVAIMTVSTATGNSQMIKLRAVKTCRIGVTY